ncbi:hypothetical protein CMI37_06105 [Candidatus Pacearchaeota archaeon]|nr:hypothetical protein [Candidatus Pacearchaeota archaeon]
MPGFNRPDFPEVPDHKINIGDYRDGVQLRVTDLYEVGSLNPEPALRDQVLDVADPVVTMEMQIAKAIGEFLGKNK